MKEKIYNNLSIGNLVKTEWFNQFDEHQKYEILEGLKSNIDVFSYANPQFSHRQMGVIRIALERGLDFLEYIVNIFKK